MKRSSVLFQIVISLVIVVQGSVAHALPPVTEPPAKLATSSLLVTGYYFSGAQLQYAQIFNTSDRAIALGGWQLRLYDDGMLAGDVRLPAMYIAPKEYVIVSNDGAVGDADIRVALPVTLSTTAVNDTMQLISSDPMMTPETVTLKVEKDAKGAVTNNHYETRQVLSQSSAGNYTSTSTFKPEAPTAPLYGRGVYQPRMDFPLMPVEVLANPRACAPGEASGDCKEYVKLYNHTAEPVSLDGVRLRAGYQGQASTSSNTAELGGVLQPGEYQSFALPLTNTGGYVWLEDSYGVVVYATTVVEYPDASSTTHKGQSWAHPAEGDWRWMLPNPTGQSAPIPVVEDTTTASTEKACAADQYRNPDTGRCKKYDVAAEPAPCADDQERNPETGRCRKVTAVAVTACDPGQERNPDTGRCRKVATTVAAALTPCKEGQERNPDTNRCRTIASATDELKPCAPGQERNPDTNRCRKIPGTNTPAGYKADPTQPAAADRTIWWALGGLGAAALGYILWEWRAEVSRAINRINPFHHQA